MNFYTLLMLLSSSAFADASTKAPEIGFHHAYGAACHSGVDILFLQDTTQTFEKDLKVVLQAIPEVFAAVQQSSPGSHFGIAEFKDRPISPFGDPNYDYPYRLAGPMTDSLDQLAAAYSELFVSSGGDAPEDQYDAMMIACFDQDIKWRPLATDSSANPEETAARIIVLITDAEPHYDLHGYDMYPETHPLKPPANPGYQEVASGKWQGNWLNYTLSYDYPSPFFVKDALDAAEIAVLFLIAHASQTTLDAWQWVNDGLLFQPASFVQPLTAESADIAPVLSSLIDQIASATCVTSTPKPTTKPTTSTEEPTTSTEEPTTSTEEPTTSTEEPTTSTEEVPTSTLEWTSEWTSKWTSASKRVTTSRSEAARTSAEETPTPVVSARASTVATKTPVPSKAPVTKTSPGDASTSDTESCHCCKLSGETVYKNVGSTELSATFAGFGSKVNKFVMSQDRACRYDSCCTDSCDCAYVGTEMLMEVDSSSDYEVRFKDIPAGVRRFRVQERQ